MKNKQIRVFCFFCLMILLFSSCERKTYRNDQRAADVAEFLAGSIGADMDFGDRGLLSDHISVPEDADLTVCIATDGMNIDEFGVWHTGDPAEARRRLEIYLADSYSQNKSYYDSYIPEQTAKLRDAEIRVYGSYVLYAILDPARKADLFRFAEELLSTK